MTAGSHHLRKGCCAGACDLTMMRPAYSECVCPRTSESGRKRRTLCLEFLGARHHLMREYQTVTVLCYKSGRRGRIGWHMPAQRARRSTFAFSGRNRLFSFTDIAEGRTFRRRTAVALVGVRRRNMLMSSAADAVLFQLTSPLGNNKVARSDAKTDGNREVSQGLRRCWI